ncbi:MAG: ferritin-like domain-containing protein [Solirubrobacterales bacterium]|nr:ferritin-like domain-containing protein [Solirubrobacterales bacterium]
MSCTRRGLFRGTVAGGVAALGLVSAADAATDGTGLLHGARTDAHVLLRLLEFEQLQGFAYEHVLHTAALQSKARSMVTQFLGQERRHAELLASELATRHVGLPAPLSNVAEADRELAAVGVNGRLTGVEREAAAVRMLIGIETVAEEIYYAAIETLSSAGPVGLAADIMACEAQHWTGLSAVLHYGNPGLDTPREFAPSVGQLTNP